MQYKGTSKTTPQIAAELNIHYIVEPTIVKIENQVKINGHFNSNRKHQDRKWLKETLDELLLNEFYQNETCVAALARLENEVESGALTSYQAASQLFEIYKKHGRI